MTLPALPPIPRMPRTDLPTEDLVKDQTDTIAAPRGEDTDDLGRPGDTDTDLSPRFPAIQDLARKIADFAPGWQNRIADHVRETARAGVLVLILVMLACGQGPVPGPDPAPAQPVQVPAAPAPAPVPPKATTPPVPSRLRLPRAWAEVEGVKIPVGPFLDTDTNRPCQLVGQADGSALCVPVDVARIDPQTETAFVDVDCQRGAARLGTKTEGWTGAHVWRVITGLPAIPDGTAAVAQRDPATGACKPVRVVMSGGWSFASAAPASLIYALVKRAALD